MSITINIYYTGKNGNARRFATEMEATLAKKIREIPGNERYEYFASLEDPETILLIDRWADQKALDVHHASPMMAELAELREKYDLHMRVERFVDDKDGIPEHDQKFIRK